MMPDASWNRIKALFQEAVEREPRDREAFLEQACGDDRALRREVESLLSAHHEAGDFAERPAIDDEALSSSAQNEYRLLSRLGAGGMGEVFRARDVTLGRDVAIKILPPIFALDPDRLARFDREAHLLASLNHPNICTIYGIADIDGTPGLVLELVAGPTLAERLAAPASGFRRTAVTAEAGGRRPMSIAEALPIARDIASALEAAHEKGIIHRDLKPGNVKLTPGGIVKVLDFGLAKAVTESASTRDVAPSPDLAASESRDGMLLGTAAYMSPEQARCEAIDKRTDIWSFGCVLYEMLTGRRVAQGETVSETLATVLEGEPDWTAVPAATPPSIQRLLRRCLEKDLKRRLKDIGDARLDIEDALATRNDGTARTTVGGWGARLTTAGYFWLWLFAAAMGLGTALFVLWPRSEQRVSSTALRRVSAELGTDASLVTLQFGQGAAAVLSPDGGLLAFVAQASDGAVRQLYVRRLDGLQATPVNGTEGALNPFFSPDSRWIAYFADGTLKKVPVTGGGPVTICTVLNNRGGAWGEDGMITFSPDRQGAGLWQVSSSGGEAKPLTTLQEGETTQRWPQMLRRGTAVLFTGNDRPDGFDGANVVVQVLPQGPRKVLVRGAYYGRYLRSGHLVYVNNETLFAAPFDLDTLELTGPAVPALDGATVNLPVGAADIAISDNGTVAYLPASGPVNYMDAPIEWMGRDGKTTPLRATPARWLHPRFAADGSRLAFALFDGVQQDVVIYDWSTDALTRLTIDPAGDLSPVWTPDGRRIAFSSTRRGRMNNIFWQRVDRAEEAQRLTESERSQTPESWHPDGRTLAFSELDPKTATPSVMMLRLEGDEAAGWRPTPPTLFLEGATSARFSPDGQWLAYVLRASAAQGAEVYVRAFQGQGGPWQVSTGGGNSPVWSSTRPELFYAAPDHRLMVATYSAKSGSFHVNKPRALPESRFAPRPVGAHFDLHPDGARFALAKSSEPETDGKRDHLTIVFDFFDELRRIAPPSN